jgi:hypothetical protein
LRLPERWDGTLDAISAFIPNMGVEITKGRWKRENSIETIITNLMEEK